MKVGLFLDVDGVCTEEAVNTQYAQMLGIRKEHEELENLFTTNQITTAEFGNRLVDSFREKGFTKKWVAEHYENITFRPYAKELFSIFEDVFIVSSAPSYFIEELAEKQTIPSERILCSKYDFDDEGLISRCSHPVSNVMKADFVDNLSRQYNISVGVGDVPEQDAAFLSHCDIRILMREYRPGFLSVRELAPIKSFLDSLKKCVAFSSSVNVDDERFTDITNASKDLLAESPYDRNVFIMTPFRKDARYRLMIRVIRDELEQYGFKGWLASDKKLHSQLWLNTQAYMLSCKYGIAVFTSYEEQEVDASNLKESVYNPNVSIELGFMLSRGKEVLILKDKTLKKLYTDMLGTLYEDFDLDNTEASLPTILKKWHDSRLK
jgi:phosphoserine phosphatase